MSKGKVMHKQQGFTLVELSIVIVIIGLIVASVLGAQSFIANAKIQSIITDINQYQSALNTFKLEYNAVPGDMKNAFKYFNNTCDNDPAKCNGDGDGKVENMQESLRFWQHLVLAKIVPGSYTGTGTAVSAINSPGSSKKSCYYKVEDAGGHPVVLHLGLLEGTTYANNGALTPKEALIIDTKIDDGKAEIENGAFDAYHDEDHCNDGADYKVNDEDYADDPHACIMRYKFK